MAHFAKIDSNNIVTQVVAIANDVLLDDNNVEQESIGVDFLNNIFGNATWKQTSYNGNLRKQFAGIGYTFDSTKNVFIKPQPFNSWTLDSNNDWQPPVERPDDYTPFDYYWNEVDQEWTQK